MGACSKKLLVAVKERNPGEGIFKLQPEGEWQRRWAEREDKGNNSVRRSRRQREWVCRNRRVQGARRVAREGESSPDVSSFCLKLCL